ncbi:MAG: hypothetical protein DMD79_02945 [Candidatus Rokuibacteriota bacterium]|nr:MAG: hypothetical protein DMD79_02945 [Candidatus Rokubacteria bacterium]
MDHLVLKLVLTPLVIGAASLAGRRWGPGVGGWLVGLPLTSGPIAFFIALRDGVGFAGAAAAGTLAGTISQAAFSVAYGWLAARGGWGACVLAGSLAFAVSTAVLEQLPLRLAVVGPSVAAGLAVAIRLLPRDRAAAARADVPSPPWDLPARMVAATGVVLLLTATAPMLGAQLTGLLSPYPVYAATLAAFAHRLEGPAAARAVLRGLLMGLFAFTAFFWVLAVILERWGIGAGFAAATGVALAVHGAALWLIRRGVR